MNRILRYVSLGNKIPKSPFLSTRRIYFMRIYEAKLVQGANRISIAKLSIPETQSFRSKYTGKKKHQEEESDSDDDENEVSVDEIKDKSSKIVKIHVNSLRADLIIKAGLGIARNKVEELFYGSKLHVNGKKIFKKSMQLHEGDEVDVVRGVSPMNPDFLVVSRVKILSATPTEDNVVVKLQRFKSLIVENYEEPWKDTDNS